MERKLDELGRIVLPLETRLALDLTEGDAVELILDEAASSLTLRKSQPCCIARRSRETLKQLPGGKYLCRACLEAAR